MGLQVEPLAQRFGVEIVDKRAARLVAALPAKDRQQPCEELLLLDVFLLHGCCRFPLCWVRMRNIRG